MLTLDSIVCRMKGVLETEVDGEIALMSTELGKYYSLNSTSTVVWKNIKTETSVAHLIEKMKSLFNVEETRCTEEVLTLLNEFSKLGLLIVR